MLNPFCIFGTTGFFTLVNSDGLRGHQIASKPAAKLFFSLTYKYLKISLSCQYPIILSGSWSLSQGYPLIRSAAHQKQTRRV